MKDSGIAFPRSMLVCTVVLTLPVLPWRRPIVSFWFYAAICDHKGPCLFCTCSISPEQLFLLFLFSSLV
jgi:hypothetical protein